MGKNGEKARILIVDDNPGIIEILAKMLCRKDYDIETAYSGKEALEKVSLKKPDLIILDCVMPNMSGIEVFFSLKKNSGTTDIPIIFCTATHIKEVQGLPGQVAGYIEKPFQAEELYSKVERVLAGKE